MASTDTVAVRIVIKPAMTSASPAASVTSPDTSHRRGGRGAFDAAAANAGEPVAMGCARTSGFDREAGASAVGTFARGGTGIPNGGVGAAAADACTGDA